MYECNEGTTPPPLGRSPLGWAWITGGVKFRRQLVMIIIILGVILSVAFITLLERKFMGAIQRRTGPTKVGILG